MDGAPWWIVAVSGMLGAVVPKALEWVSSRRLAPGNIRRTDASAAQIITDSATRLLNEMEDIHQTQIAHWQAEFQAAVDSQIDFIEQLNYQIKNLSDPCREAMEKFLEQVDVNFN